MQSSGGHSPYFSHPFVCFLSHKHLHEPDILGYLGPIFVSHFSRRKEFDLIHLLFPDMGKEEKIDINDSGRIPLSKAFTGSQIWASLK